MQGFATPWYKLRSLRLFRDQTGLSATPHLWGSIESALAQAAWFVLFASPASAASVWVDREVVWWLSHRGPERLLLVVTDGTFAWDDVGGCTGSAVSPSVTRGLKEEPRWIDLRWARGADQVSPRDPRFREAAADLAATLSGLPKDTLIGEDVRVHRRARRLATGAIVLLTVMAVAVAGLTALANTRRAEAQGALTARAAESMTVEADAIRDRDPVTALQLGVAAHRLSGTSRTEAALIESLTGPFLTIVAGHQASIRSVAWCPDGRCVGVADAAGRVTVHQVADPDHLTLVGPPVEFGEPVDGVTVLANGRELAVAAGPRVEVVTIADGHRRWSAALPDRAVALAASADGPIRIVTASGEVARWRPGRPLTIEALPGAGTVTAAAISSDGRRVATISPIGVAIWDVTSAPRRTTVVAGPSQTGTELAFADTAAQLVVGAPDGTVARWDISDPRRARSVEVSQSLVGRTLAGLAVSSDGRVTTFASIAGSITISAGPERRRVRAHRTAPVVLALSPNGTRLLSGSLDGGLVLWDTSPGRGLVLDQIPSRHSGPVLTMAVSPDGSLVATAGNDGVLFWRATPVGHLAPVPGRLAVSGAALALAFADRAMLAVGTTSGHLTIWNVADPTRPRLIREVALPGRNILDLEFFPDGQTVVAAGEDLGVHLIDIESGTVEAISDVGGSRSIALRPDGTRLIVPNTFLNSFAIVDVTDRRRPVVAGRSPNGHETVAVEAMTFTADGRLLVSAGREGKLVISAFDDPDHSHEVGEIETAERAQTRDNAAALYAVSISRDGRILAAAGKDGPLRLWDLANPSQPRPLSPRMQDLRGEVYGVALLPDGLTLTAGGQDDQIATYDLTRLAELRRSAVLLACSRAGAPLSPEAWSRLAPGLEYRDTCRS